MTFDNFNNTRYLRRFVLGCSFRLAGKVDAQIYMQSKIDDIKSNSLKECFVFFFTATMADSSCKANRTRTATH